MKRLLSCLALACATVMAAAATPDPRIAAFLPEGWSLEQQLDADLDGDQRKDVILLLAEQDGEFRRRLLALVDTGSSLHLAGRLELEDAPQAPTLSLRRGVLLVESELGGATDVLGMKQRFRHEAGSGRMRLIGVDVSAYSRVNATDSTELSFNTLTGQRILKLTPVIDTRPDGSELSMEERSYGDTRSSERRVKPPQWYMEDAPEAHVLLQQDRGSKQP
ncbi:MAG TPA: hypothetical protein VLI06_12235 [Solimonas sp.]|nr:hypothetical protein [Solimonas sp.]